MTERFDDQVLDWLTGQLSTSDAEAFAAELARNPGFKREVAAAREMLALNALADPVAPSDLLRRRVLGAVGPVPVAPAAASRSEQQRSGWGWQAALIAAIALLAFTTIKWRSASNDLDELATVRDSIGAELARSDSLLALITSPHIELINLVAETPSPPAIRVMIDSTRRLLFLSAASLPKLPADSDYQLWYIVAGAPVASAIFHPDSTGSARVVNVPMPARSAIQALAVTVEPRGGSPAPTTAPRYLTPLGK